MFDRCHRLFMSRLAFSTISPLFVDRYGRSLRFCYLDFDEMPFLMISWQIAVFSRGRGWILNNLRDLCFYSPCWPCFTVKQTDVQRNINSHLVKAALIVYRDGYTLLNINVTINIKQTFQIMDDILTVDCKSIYNIDKIEKFYKKSFKSYQSFLYLRSLLECL